MKAKGGKGIKPVGAEARWSGKRGRRGGGRGNPQCTIRGGGRGPGLRSPLTLSYGGEGSSPRSLHLSAAGTAQSRVRGRKGEGGFSALTTTPFPQPGAADNNRHNGSHTKAPSSYSPAPARAAAQTMPRQRGPPHGRQALARPLPPLAGGKGEGTPGALTWHSC